MPVEYKDYYKSLGVSKTAGDDEIRTAFRKLARQYHPDVAKDKASAEEKFKEINEAYEVLGDPEKRKKYDSFGGDFNATHGFGSPGAGGGPFGGGGGRSDYEFRGTGFSDFFEQFFGARGSRAPDSRGNFGFEENGGRGQFRGPARGNDIEGDLMVTLEEALRGSVRTISLERSAGGRARTPEVSTFRVRIPAGVQEGQIIRVPGKGDPGQEKAGAGDLYLRVRFAKHPDLRVRGADLLYDLVVAPWESVLGAHVSVPTPEGSVEVKIPAGSMAGQQLRVRDRGLPAAGGGRGDLYVIISIQTPKKVSAEERKLWEELARLSEFQPRAAGETARG